MRSIALTRRPGRGGTGPLGRRDRPGALVRLAVAALLVLGAQGCRWRLADAAFARGVVDVACCGQAGGPVRVTYLGVGGLLIEWGDARVLTAPLFTNPSLIQAGFATYHPDADRIERHLPDVRGVSAILVGHAHYDHLMDVPYIARERAPAAVIYGTRTVAHTLAPFGLRPMEGCAGDGADGGPGPAGGKGGEDAGSAGRVCVVDDAVGTADRPGRWIDAGLGVRIMPLRSHHAPHFAGETLYQGDRRRDLERVPDRSDEWLSGPTLAYLVDLLDEAGGVAFRIYYQDAVPAPPAGLVPTLPDGHGVDLAVLVPATHAEVRWHPEAVVENTRPRQVVLVHWEDFFRPPSAPVRPLQFLDLRDFVNRLERALPSGAAWHIPEPGTVLVFR